MANKTANEKLGALTKKVENGAIREWLNSNSFTVAPDIGEMVKLGYEVTRFLKMEAGQALRCYFLRLEDGELSESKIDQKTGEVPRVKWAFVQLEGNDAGGAFIGKILCGYNLAKQLESLKDGSEVIIIRGPDQKIGGGFNVTDWIVMHKPDAKKPPAPVVVSHGQAGDTAREVKGERVS